MWVAQAPPDSCRLSHVIIRTAPSCPQLHVLRNAASPPRCSSPTPFTAVTMSRDDDSFGGAWGNGQFDPTSRPSPGETERQWILRNADSLGINYDSLPHPPFWSPLFGQGQNWYRVNVASKVMGFSVLLKRELTQQEKDAVSYHAAKECSTRALEPPAAVAVAYFLERRGRSTFKFPFWAPKPTTINPDVFLSQRFPLLRNNMAWAAWHATRFSCYAFASHLFLSGIFISYGMSVWVANMKLDPRLDTLRKTMEELGKQGRLGRRLGEQTTGPESWHSASENEDPSMRDSSFPYSSQSSGDDSAARGTGDNFAKSEETTQSRGYPRPGRGYPSPQDSRQQGQGSTFQSQEEDDAHLFDDASPIAPSARGKGASASGSGGSAWDRIRNQAVSGGNAGGQAGTRSNQQSWSETQRNSGQSNTSGQGSDGYTYSAEEENKSYAKSQAQKEFDAMLEKERRGESDNRGRRF